MQRAKLGWAPLRWRTGALCSVCAAAMWLAGCDQPKPPGPPTPQMGPTGSAPVQPPAVPNAAPAPAINSAAPVVATGSLSDLQPYVGTYPSDSNMSFLEQGVLADRLKPLLGKDYATLLANMRTVSPLTAAPASTGQAPRWYITGNRPHEGGKEMAAVVVDPAQNAVRVWMLHHGQVQVYQDPPQADVPWPPEVATLIDQQAQRPAVAG